MTVRVRPILVTFVMAALFAAGCSTLNPPPSLFVVYFPAKSAVLSPDANKIVSEAAHAVLATHPKAVAISAGVPVGDNLKLAEPRYAAVRDGLIADGVDTALIARAAIPEDKRDVGGVGNQRVEIRLLPAQ